MTGMETWAEPRAVMLRVGDFLQLHEAGAFRDYAKTELIGGTVVAMNSQLSLHARTKSRLFRRLAGAVDANLAGFEALSEVSVAIPPHDVPESDIAVTSFEANSRLPVPVETVALIVEVADTTIRFDEGAKARLYATAGIPEYWVADVNGRVIHQMWAPVWNDYQERRSSTFGEAVTSATIPGLMIETATL